MNRFPSFIFTLGCTLSCGAQSADSIVNYFEGKTVVVKLDMPGSQKGVDVFPNRPQSLDTRSYADRVKSFGVALRSGDSVMITKVKVKGDNVEFQLGGGGFGTARDNSDTSVYYTPADKSDHEKELEDQINKETDPDRRRSLSRELDDLRRDRERKDNRRQAQAEYDASVRRDQVSEGRAQGGSRFNLRFDKGRTGDAVNPQSIMAALAPYVYFPAQSFGPNVSQAPAGTNGQFRGDPGGPPPPAALVNSGPPANPLDGLRKGLTVAQMEALFGPASDAQESTQDGMTKRVSTYQTAHDSINAEFINGVLVQYTVSSR